MEQEAPPVAEVVDHASMTRPGRPALLSSVTAAMRPKQWLKNGFVAAAGLFSMELFTRDGSLTVAAAVACFCAISSAVYLLNDVIDREEDQHHPRKRLRPIASGAVSIPVALAAAAVLASLAVVGALALDPWFAATVVGYAANSIAYVTWFKYQVLLDVFSIAAGFVVRVLAGAVVLRVDASDWILICTGLLALMLGFAKRRHELLSLGREGPRHRQVLTEYSPAFLDSMMLVSAGATVTSYAVYTATGVPAEHHLAATLPFVVYGVARYLWLVLHRDEGGSPTNVVWNDRPIQAALVGWTITSAVLLAI
jgi:4-hydroxybenzoate polyprenyltransferase